MRAYLALFRCRCAALMQYRAAACAGIVTQLFWGILKVMVLTAFYASSTMVQPMSLADASTFIWIGQGLFLLVPWNIDKEIEAQIHNGQVAYELVRPVNLYGLWFVRSLALRAVPVLLRCSFMYPIAYLFFGFTLPASWSVAFLFLLSMVLATLVAAAITTMVMLSLFWTISGEGILKLLPAVTLLFSGLYVPLPLFPEWMQPFVMIQPLRCIADIPSRIYTGMIPFQEVGLWLGFQVLWLLILVWGGRVMAQKAAQKLVVQGG